VIAQNVPHTKKTVTKYSPCESSNTS